MKSVKIDKSSSYIEYDDGKDAWNAMILFDLTEDKQENKEKEIILLETTRILKNRERNNIITEILNKYAFGIYLNKEYGIWKAKLKNRGLEKKVELGYKDQKSYSIIGEEVLELPENDNDCEMVKSLRSVYLNLRTQAVEYKKNLKNSITVSHKTPWNYIKFNFEGTKSEYKLLCKILKSIKDEIEDALSKYIKHSISLEILSGNFKDKKATIDFLIKEAN